MPEAARGRPWRALGLAGLTILAALLPVSIAGAELGLALAVLGWLLLGRPGPPSPLLPPAALYAALTLLSAVASPRPLESLADTKELLLLSLLLVVPAQAHAARRLEGLFLASLAVGAAWGMAAHLAAGGGLESRARGPYGHYLTFAGVVMLGCLLSASRLLGAALRPAAKGRPSLPGRLLEALRLLLLLGALAASYARSAWVGLSLGLLLLVLLVRPRLLPALLLAGALVWWAAPGELRARAGSILSLEANRDRLEMWQVGLRLVRRHPLLGVGPNQVPRAWPEVSAGRVHPHLHDNLVQIAAERGLPALGAWLWLMIRFARGLVRITFRHDRLGGATGLACLSAVLLAGLFEYNFGDSEVKLAFLLLTSLALHRSAPAATLPPPPRPSHDPA